MKKDYSTLLWYVYTVRYADGTVFYVGKGKGRRIDMHERQALTLKEVSIKSAHIIDTYLDGQQVIKQIEAWFRVEQHALIYEAMLIEAYGLDNLANINAGIKTRSLEVTDIATRENEDTTEEDIDEMIRLLEPLDDEVELLPDTNNEDNIKVRIQRAYSQAWVLYEEYHNTRE